MKINGHNAKAKKYSLDLLALYKKSEPYVDYYMKQIKSYNDTAHHILKNEIDLMSPQLPAKCARAQSWVTQLASM